MVEVEQPAAAGLPSVGASASGESERMQANNAATGMGLQLQKIASEIKLNDSIAKKNEAEANLTSGAETGLKEAQTTQISEIIKNLSADTELKGEQSKLAELQQNSLKIQNEFNTSNNETLLKQNIEILKELTAKANVAESTQTDLINLAKANVKEVTSKALLNNSQIQLNESEKQLISNEIDQITNNIKIALS